MAVVLGITSISCASTSPSRVNQNFLTLVRINGVSYSVYENSCCPLSISMSIVSLQLDLFLPMLITFTLIGSPVRTPLQSYCGQVI